MLFLQDFVRVQHAPQDLWCAKQKTKVENLSIDQMCNTHGKGEDLELEP